MVWRDCSQDGSWSLAFVIPKRYACTGCSDVFCDFMDLYLWTNTVSERCTGGSN